MSRGHRDVRDVKRLKSQLFENYSYDKFIILFRNQSNVIDVSHHIQVVVTSYSQSAFMSYDHYVNNSLQYIAILTKNTPHLAMSLQNCKVHKKVAFYYMPTDIL